MGKDGGPMTAKAVAKKIKAKGLGRLRWYCQMCEKQCRDENGFKNHTASASHQRQLALFSENASENVSRFSEDFRREFLAVLRQRYGSILVGANTVYQEYIKDKQHLHMNATRWTTLTDFVTELGRDGYCRVVDKADGFWISYIDRTVSEKDRLARKMDEQRLREEQSADMYLQHQIQAAMRASSSLNPTSTDDAFQEGSGPMSMRLQRPVRSAQPSQLPSESTFFPKSTHSFRESARASSVNTTKRRRSRWDEKGQTSALQEIMQSEKKSSEKKVKDRTSGSGGAEKTISKSIGTDIERKSSEDSPWLTKGIVVKVTNKELANGAYYGAKGRVVAVLDEFGAQIQLLDTDTVLELDQDDLETTIPKAGGNVLIIRGPYKGEKAEVVSINIDSYTVTVRERSSKIHELEYEDVSRVL